MTKQNTELFSNDYSAEKVTIFLEMPITKFSIQTLQIQEDASLKIKHHKDNDIPKNITDRYECDLPHEILDMPNTIIRFDIQLKKRVGQ